MFFSRLSLYKPFFFCKAIPFDKKTRARVSIWKKSCLIFGLFSSVRGINSSVVGGVYPCRKAHKSPPVALRSFSGQGSYSLSDSGWSPKSKTTGVSRTYAFSPASPISGVWFSVHRYCPWGADPPQFAAKYLTQPSGRMLMQHSPGPVSPAAGIQFSRSIPFSLYY